MSVVELAAELARRGSRLPVIALAYDVRDLAGPSDLPGVDRVFLWQGDVGILPAIVKYVEDRQNVAADTGEMGVQAIILIEDSVRYYSSFLPVIYSELMRHSQSLVPEGINLSHKLMRLQARPKILLCTSFEEAWGYFAALRGQHPRRHRRHRVPERRRARAGSGAGVRADGAPAPARRADHAAVERGRERGAGLGRRRRVPAQGIADAAPPASAVHDRELRVSATSCSACPTAPSWATRRDLRSARGTAPHGARREPRLPRRAQSLLEVAQGAHRVRAGPPPAAAATSPTSRRRAPAAAPDSVDPRLPEPAEARHRRGLRRGHVRSRRRASAASAAGRSAARAGASRSSSSCSRSTASRRGFAACASACRRPSCSAPTCSTASSTRAASASSSLAADDDEEILRTLLAAPFPEKELRDLAAYLEVVRYPLAVRSSSLLEDSPYQPFAGIYDTWMVPNRDPDRRVRLDQLHDAICRVYASTFSRRAKAYLRASPYRLEEEKMAVVIQKVAGQTRGNRHYPDLAGVARSHNFYAVPPLQPRDGVAAVALGLGATVVGGETCFRFSPRHPRHVVQFSSVEDVKRNSQRLFYALRLDDDRARADGVHGFELEQYGLETAERDGALAAIGSTYSPENDAVFDGIARPGVRLVSFAPILKHGVFPARRDPEPAARNRRAGDRRARRDRVCRRHRRAGRTARRVRVPAAPARRAFTRARPGSISAASNARRCCARATSFWATAGWIEIRDVVVVDSHRFGAARSQEIAAEIGRLNAQLMSRARAVPADRRRAPGIERADAGRARDLGPDRRRARHRRGRVSRLQSHTVPGVALLPEPDDRAASGTSR